MIDKEGFIDHLQRFQKRLRNKNLWILVASDCALITIAHVLAHLIRFEFEFQRNDLDHFLRFIPLSLLFRLPIFYFFRLYSGMWRYTSFKDLTNILKAVLVSSALIIVFLLYQNRFVGYSRGILVLDFILVFLFISGFRIGVRWYYRNGFKSLSLGWLSKDKEKKKLLVIGAGQAAEKLVREVLDNNQLDYCVVGFLDDDPNKNGLRIHNIPIWGPIDLLPEFVEKTDADELLIAIASTSREQLRRIVAICRKVDIPYKIIPGMGEIITGKQSVGNFRKISYKDLLGREPVTLDHAQIGMFLNGKSVLVTGAGGSIGSELTRQIVRFKPDKIILFDSGEENLYNIQMTLRNELEFFSIETILGQVQDVTLLRKVFSSFSPQVVFHAAAYKHVPMIENNPWQAVENNIVATRYIIEASVLYQVERFVLVSTDKAVRPTNVMGASKRMTEHLLMAYRQSDWKSLLSQEWSVEEFDNKIKNVTRLMAVRFGNVLGSSGSVIPLFMKQIELGGPITVTHPEITRYFMSIEEAAQLILQAGAMGRGGEIFVLKMGKAVKITNLAEELIELSGKTLGVDIQIKYSGLREGEKLYEELITEGENIVETDHEKIMVLRSCDFLKEDLNEIILRLQKASGALSGDKIKKVLMDALPEYRKMVEMNSKLIESYQKTYDKN